MNFSALHLNKSFFYATATLWTWLVFVFLVTGNTFYEVNDNLQIEWLISGALGKSIYEFPRFFQLYGYPLHFMYELFPNVSWMGVLFVLLNYISGLCILWCLVERTRQYHFRIRLALILVVVAFLTDFILYLDFTRSALLTGVAGVFLFFCSEKYWSKALALILIIAAIGLRFMAIYFVGFMSVIWLFYEFKLNRLLVAYGAVLVLSFLCFGIPSKKFSGFLELNKAKTIFNDYGVFRTEFKEENCFGSWFFLDEEINKQVIIASKEVPTFSRFSFKKLESALFETKGQIQWVILIVLAALLTKRYSVLVLYLLSFLGMVCFLKFSVKVFVVLSLFLILLAVFIPNKKAKQSDMKLKWLISLMVVLLLVVVKTTKRISFSREVCAENLSIINLLHESQKDKKLYLINMYEFKRFINPFSIEKMDFKNAISLTGWHTILPEYKKLIQESLNLPNQSNLQLVSKQLKNNYIILDGTDEYEFNNCVNSKLNLKIEFVNQRQLMDNGFVNEKLKLFYVH